MAQDNAAPLDVATIESNRVAARHLASVFTSEIAATDAENDEERESQDETEVDETEEESDTEEQADDTDEESEEEGSEDEESDEDAETEEDTDLEGLDFKAKNIPVVVDGKDELWSIEDLQKSASREAHFTRKSQALATEKKDFESTKAQTTAREQEASRKAAEYAELLPQVRKAIEVLHGKEPNWADLRSKLEPGEYAAARADWDDRQKRIGEIKAEEERAQAEVRTSYQKGMQEYAISERTKLDEAIPEWKDQTVKTAELAAIRAHALSKGWTDQELADTIDHRAIVSLRDSWLLAKRLGKKPALVKKLKKASAPAGSKSTSRTVKPVSKIQGSAERLRRSGSVRDAGAFFSDMIAAEEAPRNKRRK